MIRASLLRRGRPTSRLLSARPKNHPFILQYPSESLLQPVTNPISTLDTSGKQALVEQLLHTRSHYEFPGLSAVQMGWNVPAFVVSIPKNERNFAIRKPNAVLQLVEEGSAEEVIQEKAFQAKEHDIQDIFLGFEPQIHWASRKVSWAWEACASCCMLMHYIERPADIIASWKNPVGDTIVAHLTGLGSRLVQHEMDHIRGQAFYHRIPNQSHAVPLCAFRSMSQWDYDFPSLEARSTYLYSMYTPPFTFRAEVPPKSGFIDRILDEQVYPGVHFDEEMNDQFITNPVQMAGNLPS